MVNRQLPSLRAKMTNWLMRSRHAGLEPLEFASGDALPKGRALTPFIASRCPRDARMVGTELKKVNVSLAGRDPCSITNQAQNWAMHRSCLRPQPHSQDRAAAGKG